VAFGRCEARSPFTIIEPGDARFQFVAADCEVSQLEFARFRGEQDVVRFEVAMHYVLVCVEVDEGGG